MALSLEVQAGSRIRIGEAVMQVLEVVRATVISVEVDGKHHVITDQERTEVLPDVFVSCGVKKTWRKDERTRLAFEAPRVIRINRLDQPVFA